MAKIKIKRGLEASLGSITLEDGEFAVTTDTKKLYIGLGGSQYCIGSASSLGDMLKSIYDTDNDGIVDKAEKADNLTTGRNINGVPFDGTTDITITAAANGGNADTIDLKHASDFAPSGFGLGTASTYKTAINANTILATGFYRCENCTNMPIASTWFYMTVESHDVSSYVSQVATYYFEVGREYKRELNAGVWSAWYVVPKMTKGTANPAGGVDGDVYFQYV